MLATGKHWDCDRCAMQHVRHLLVPGEGFSAGASNPPCGKSAKYVIAKPQRGCGNLPVALVVTAHSIGELYQEIATVASSLAMT